MMGADRIVVRSQPQTDADGAPGDLDALYRAHSTQVSRWVRALVGRTALDADAEDLVHEIFLVADRQRASFRGDSRVTTWLYGITARVVSRRRRRWKLWRRFFGANATAHVDERLPRPTSPSVDQHAQLERREDLARIYRLLDRLPDKQRQVLVLYEIEELSGPEIAELTAQTLANVWAQLSRGRRALIRMWAADAAKKGAGR